MRNAFAKCVTEIAKKNKKIVLLSGDIGNRLFNDFRKKFNDRFYNCGIAEANMTSVASGLSTCNFKPITYTIASFNTVRCLEQIRLDVCYPNRPVIIVGTGAGLSYANLGSTHHTVEDIGILKNFPNLQILCPSDASETELALKEAIKSNKPTYIRLGKKGEPDLKLKSKFKIGKIHKIAQGKKKDLLIITYGTIVSEVIKSLDLLKKENIHPTVLKVDTISPINFNEIIKYIKNYKNILIVEEHLEISGFGSQICELIFKKKIKNKNVKIIGLPKLFLSSCGNQNQAREKYGISFKKIFNKIKSIKT